MLILSSLTNVKGEQKIEGGGQGMRVIFFKAPRMNVNR